MMLFVCFLVLLSWGPYAFAESLTAITGRTDWSCVKPQMTGQTCARATYPYVGVKMKYWQPVLLVETVKKPGDTAIDEFRSLLGSSLKTTAAAALGVSSGELDSGSLTSSDTSSTQMNDVHVFGYPFSSEISTMIEPSCEGSPDYSSAVNYLSEADASEWRMLKMESKNPFSLITEKMAPMCEGKGIKIPGMCMGVWGPLYPRGGFIAGHDPAVGSAAMAYRAVDVASYNISSATHVRVSPLMFLPDMSVDLMQMVYPKKTQCLSIGEDPRTWEKGGYSNDGKYVWVYWRRKECCAL